MHDKHTVEIFCKRVPNSKSIDECWEWLGNVNKSHGYGEVSIGPRGASKRYRAHRLSWEIHNGKQIPDGLFVCHKCDNRKCVNPHHLFLGDDSANVVDCVLKGRHSEARKTHCPKGHPYSGENLSFRGKHRRCKQCDRDYKKLRAIRVVEESTHA